MRNKDFEIVSKGISFDWNRPNEQDKKYYNDTDNGLNYRDSTDNIVDLKEQVKQLHLKNLELAKENEYLKSRVRDFVEMGTENYTSEALEISGFGTWQLIISTGIIRLSGVASKIYGLELPMDEISLERAQSLIYQQDTKENSVHLKNLLEKNIPYCREFRITRVSDNEIRWVRVEGGLVRDSGGLPVKVIGTIRDITNSKKISTALEKSEESHRIISDMISDFVYVIEGPFDRSIKYNWINKGLIYVYGYSKDEISSYGDFLKIVNPEDRDKLEGRLQILLSGKETITEYRIIDKIGGERWVRDYSKPVFNSATACVERLYGALQDITVSKLADIALRNSHLKLRSIFDTIPGSICVIDKEMNIVDCNFNFLKLYGFGSRNDILSRNFADVIANEMLETEVKILKNVLSTGKPVTRISIENEILGNKNIFKINTSPINDDNGNIAGAINVYTDITDLKSAETQLINLIGELSDSKRTIETQLTEINAMNNQLVQSEDKLKRLNTDKDKLFSIIAHDLRNPLSSILNFTEMLNSEPDGISPPEMKQIHEVLNNSAKHLYKLLENLLEWSRSQTGGIEYKPVKFNLNEIIFDNTFLFQKPAQAKKIELVSVYPEKSLVYADYNMIDTVVRNLLSNAIKFTKPGGRVAVSITSEENCYRITVRDSGIGMSSQERINLFSLDKTVSRTGTANEKGTGLGLLIIKEFVSLHGSEIKVESELGQGSAFSFCLPLQKD